MQKPVANRMDVDDDDDADDQQPSTSRSSNNKFVDGRINVNPRSTNSKQLVNAVHKASKKNKKKKSHKAMHPKTTKKDEES